MFHSCLHVNCNTEYSEMLIAELSEIGFDTFMENETGFEAYAEQDKFDRNALDSIIGKYNALAPLTIRIEKIAKKNWNEEWEKNYEPINVEDRCLIRAEFHKPEKEFQYEVIITPKMSFGTGHHQTTYLMIKNQMSIDHDKKRVMDAGCGTAILSIMACKLGANQVEAFDIDEWSVVNGEENIEMNHCTGVHLQQGKITEVELTGKFDLILANINKNVLLEEIKVYSTYLNRNGLLLLSGFYTKDIPDILAESVHYNFVELKRDMREDWACLLLEKI